MREKEKFKFASISNKATLFYPSSPLVSLSRDMSSFSPFSVQGGKGGVTRVATKKATQHERTIN